MYRENGRPLCLAVRNPNTQLFSLLPGHDLNISPRWPQYVTGCERRGWWWPTNTLSVPQTSRLARLGHPSHMVTCLDHHQWITTKQKWSNCWTMIWTLNKAKVLSTWRSVDVAAWAGNQRRNRMDGWMERVLATIHMAIIQISPLTVS